MTTVLVTGGLGFIGRHVSRYFRSQGCRVIGIGHGEVTGREADEIGLHRWQSGDVSRVSLDALAEPVNLVIHCAGSSAVGASFDDPDAEFRKNVGAADEILEFVRHQNPRPRIVVLSSAAVYGVVTHLPIREDAPLNPISPYGRNKCVIEERCRQAGAEHELEISIVRFFSVYGSGLRKLLFWDACQKFANGESRFGGSGAERRDWLHIRDALRLIDVSASHASAAVPIINGGTGKSVMVSDALARLRALWGMPSAIAFSGQARPGDPPGYEADIARARSLGWTPVEEFDSGLAEYVSWARGVLRP